MRKIKKIFIFSLFFFSIFFITPAFAYYTKLLNIAGNTTVVTKTEENKINIDYNLTATEEQELYLYDITFLLTNEGNNILYFFDITFDIPLDTEDIILTDATYETLDGKITISNIEEIALLTEESIMFNLKFKSSNNYKPENFKMEDTIITANLTDRFNVTELLITSELIENNKYEFTLTNNGDTKTNYWSFEITLTEDTNVVETNTNYINHQNKITFSSNDTNNVILPDEQLVIYVELTNEQNFEINKITTR